MNDEGPDIRCIDEINGIYEIKGPESFCHEMLCDEQRNEMIENLLALHRQMTKDVRSGSAKMRSLKKFTEYISWIAGKCGYKLTYKEWQIIGLKRGNNDGDPVYDFDDSQ
jgi:hypothetical protein